LLAAALKRLTDADTSRAAHNDTLSDSWLAFDPYELRNARQTITAARRRQ
jgi:hypothetical protein